MNSDNKNLDVTITGGNNIIALQSTNAAQNIQAQTTDSVPGNATSSDFLSKSPIGIYRHFITHEAVGVPELIRGACRHLVFHAAYYPKYGFDKEGKHVWDAMKQKPNLRLTAIFTDADHTEWVGEFARILRPYFTIDDFKSELEISKRHFVRCLNDFGSRRVHIYDTARLPMFPIIMIDDTLVIGHYAHSTEIAPDGLWFTVKHPCVMPMYESLLADITPEFHTNEERAILRYIEELIVTP